MRFFGLIEHAPDVWHTGGYGDSDMWDIAAITHDFQDFIDWSLWDNDVSEPCLKVGQDLLVAYFRGLGARFAAERIIPVTAPFPKSNAQLSRIARLSRPYDLCCLSYALAPLDEQSGLQAISQGIGLLADACAPASGRIVVLQDKFHESLLRKVCRELGPRREKRSSHRLSTTPRIRTPNTPTRSSGLSIQIRSMCGREMPNRSRFRHDTAAIGWQLA